MLLSVRPIRTVPIIDLAHFAVVMEIYTCKPKPSAAKMCG